MAALLFGVAGFTRRRFLDFIDGTAGLVVGRGEDGSCGSGRKAMMRRFQRIIVNRGLRLTCQVRIAQDGVGGSAYVWERDEAIPRMGEIKEA